MLANILANKGPLPILTDPETGKVYQVSYLTQERKVAFEQWLVDGARAVAVVMKDALSPEEWRAEMRAFRDEVAQGRFGFHGDVSLAAMETTDGKAKLISILFDCPVEEMIGLVLRCPDLVKAVLDQVIGDSLPRSRQAAPTAGEASEGAEGNAPPGRKPRRASR